MKILSKTILVVLVWMLQYIDINAQTISKEKIKKVDSIFTSHYNSKSPGGGFAIIQQGEEVFKKTIGLANIEYQIPISDTTVFNIASNSKQMTTLLAFILEEEGRLSFDDDIRNYLPELKGLPYKVTIKQLTNHSHGLPNVDELAKLKGIERMTHDEVLNMLFDGKQFNFKPGDDYQYNNTGYVLLSEIITRVGEKPFQEQLKEKVFDKLGMRHSHAVGDYNQVIPNKAYSYSETKNGMMNNPVKISTMGASGVYASLNDLIVWAQKFIKKGTKNQQYLKLMQQETILNNNKLITYGMGIQFENYKGVDILFHGGGTESYRSYILHVPEHELSLVFLSNAGGFSGYEIIYNSLEAILELESEDKQQAFNNENLSSFEGVYELTPGAYYNIWAEKDSLYFGTYRTTERFVLTRKERKVFDFIFPFSQITFRKDGFDLRWVDFTYRAKKVAPPISKDSDFDLNRFAGIYTNKEHNSIYELVVIDNKLIAKHPIHSNIELDIYSKKCMYAKNSYFGKVDFLFNSEGKVQGFKLSRQNIMNLTFLR